MITKLNRFVRPQLFITPFLKTNHCPTRFYSTFRASASSILKHSRFSQYMGLSQELRKLQKQQQAQQKKQVRYSTTVIVASLIGFCSIVFYMTQDAIVRLKFTIYLAKVKLSFLNKEQAKEEQLEQMIKEVQSFMAKHPYEQSKIPSILKELALNSRRIASCRLQQSLEKIYVQLINGNKKMKQKRVVLQGLLTIAQSSLMKEKCIQQVLLLTLMQKGQIKQIYLALVCLLKVNKATFNEQLKTRIYSNLQKQYLLQAKYYSQLQLQNFPHIQFKRFQLLRWKTFIQQSLNLHKQ